MKNMINKKLRVFDTVSPDPINCVRFHSVVNTDGMEIVKLTTIQPLGENGSDIFVTLRGAVSSVNETNETVDYIIQILDVDDEMVTKQISDEITELLYELRNRQEDKTARHLELSLITHKWENVKRTIKVG